MGIFKKRNEYFYESFVELSTLSLNTYECLVKGIKEFNHDDILELKSGYTPQRVSTLYLVIILIAN